MKKIIILLLALTLLLASCDSKAPDTSKPSESPAESAESQTQVFKAYPEILTELLGAHPLPSGDVYRSDSDKEGEYLNDDLIGGIYGELFESPDFTKIIEYAVCIDETPLKPQEVGLFRAETAEDALSLSEFIRARIDRLIENAKNYTSIDDSGIKNAIIKTEGETVYYIVLCEGREEAETLVRTLLSGRIG